MFAKRIVTASLAIICCASAAGCAQVVATAPIPPDIMRAEPPPPPPELFAPVDGRAYASVQIDEALALRQSAPAYAQVQSPPPQAAPTTPPVQVAQSAVAPAPAPLRLAAASNDSVVAAPAAAPAATFKLHAVRARVRPAAVVLAAAPKPARIAHPAIVLASVERGRIRASRPVPATRAAGRILSAATPPRAALHLGLFPYQPLFEVVDRVVRHWIADAGLSIGPPAELRARHISTAVHARLRVADSDGPSPPG